MSKVDLPLGWNCNSTKQIVRNGKRSNQYPFDWIGWHSYDTIIRLMDDGFQTAFTNFHVGTGETYEVRHQPGRQIQTIWDTDFKFIAAHLYWDGRDMAEVRTQYQTLYSNLISDLNVATEATLHIGHSSEASMTAAFDYYTNNRLMLDVRSQINTDRTLDELIAKFQEFTPNCTVTAVETTYDDHI